MLRIEKMFQAHAINEELEAYLPLIPDRHNWKATFMIEYEDADERARQLARLIGVENKVWLQVDKFQLPLAVRDSLANDLLHHQLN
jgi:hypothetical protein